MTGYDFNRPYVEADSLAMYRAIDAEVAARYGKVVRASSMSNSEYAARHARLSGTNSMKPPPSHLRIFGGYLVVRRLGRPDQYETWMPGAVFDEIYEPE